MAKHFAFGPDGKRLNIPSKEVKDYTLSFINDEDSKILLVIAEKPNGDLLVNAFGVPSRKIYNLLAQTLEQYDKALKLNEN